ncbi:MFS transporter [Fodinicola acaciae]|uniref:MFS transporter n=1 Tax=Fodinicola acaciae TaxID=2681555 RepID=UPI0013D0689C|nr:MFS transporter [Fodinicola acaciae]
MRSVLGDLRGGGYRTVLAAAGASAVGDGVRDAALPLLALAVLRDPVQVAVVSAANKLPWLLFALPAGAYADRLDRRRLMVGADLVRSASLAVGAGLLAAGQLSFASLVALAFVLGTGGVVFQCASYALVPSMVGKDLLQSANGWQFGVQTLGRELLGRTLGGTLFAAGRAIPLLVDAASFGMSALLLSTVAIPRRPPSRRGRRLLVDIADGFRFLASDRLLVVLTVAAALINLVLGGQTAVLVLLAVDELHVEPFGYGVLLACGGIGGVVAGAVAGRLVGRIGARAVMVAAVAALGGSGLATAVATGLPLAAVAAFVQGAALMLWNVPSMSARQATVPDVLLGRVIGVHRLASWGAMPVGAVVLGALTGVAGVRPAYAAGGALLVVLAAAVARPLKAWGRQSPAAG